MNIKFKEHLELIFFTWLHFPGAKIVTFSFQNINHD